LAQNKAKNEVFSYRQALNEAWKELESSLAPDVLQSMRVAERRAAAIAHGAFEEDDADALFFSEEKEDSDDDDDDEVTRNNNNNSSSSSNSRANNEWRRRNNKFGPKLPERKKKEKQEQPQQRHKRKPSTLQRVGSLVNVVTGGGKGKGDCGDEDIGVEGEDENDGSRALVTFDALQTHKSPRASRSRWFDTPSDAEEEDIDEEIDDIIRNRIARNNNNNNNNSKSKRAVANNKNKKYKSGSNGLKRNGVLSIVQRSVLHLVEDVRCFPQDADEPFDL
jgi:hypothetical protein